MSAVEDVAAWVHARKTEWVVSHGVPDTVDARERAAAWLAEQALDHLRVVWEPGMDSEHTVDRVTADARDRCQGCARPVATERSHRRSRGQGGLWAPSNIMRLCRRCHAWAEHGNPTAADAAGWRIVHRPTAIPALTPVWAWMSDRAWPAWWLIGDDGAAVWVDDEPAPTVPQPATSQRPPTKVRTA